MAVSNKAAEKEKLLANIDSGSDNNLSDIPSQPVNAANNERSSSQDSLNDIVQTDGQINDVGDSVDSILNRSLQGSEEFKVYRSRWYVLALFCTVSFLQSGLCYCWTVIAQTVEVTFNWSNSQVSLMQTWYYATYLFAMFPFAYLMDTKGLRVSVIICMTLVVCCTTLRCISMTPPITSWLNNIANFCLGVAGPVPFTSGPVISSLWFPSHQRSTATSLAMAAGFMGPAFSFILGPTFIDSPKVNNTVIPSNSEDVQYINIAEMRRQIRHVRLGECILAVIVLIAVLIYFPSKPPSPPSRSASLPKLNVFNGVRLLFKMKYLNFWLLCAAASISTGIYGVWMGLIDVLLKPRVSEVEAGWMGFASVVVGCVAAVLIGRLADLISGKMKLICVVLLCASVVAAYWFILISQHYIEHSTYQLYAAVILIGLCNNGPVPLYFEMSAETNYPVSEIVTSSMLTIMYNVWPIIFLCIFVIPNIGVSWMSWCLFGSLILCVPLLLCFKERYNRLQVDSQIVTVINGPVSEEICEDIVSDLAH